MNADFLARVGTDTILTSGCIIGAKCELNTNEMLIDNTIIFGSKISVVLLTRNPRYSSQISDS